jgi:hypothetical protein
MSRAASTTGWRLRWCCSSWPAPWPAVARRGEAPLVHALVELAIGVAVGVMIGAGGARLLVFARRTSWSSVAEERLAVLVLPVVTYLPRSHSARGGRRPAARRRRLHCRFTHGG